MPDDLKDFRANPPSIRGQLTFGAVMVALAFVAGMVDGMDKRERQPANAHLAAFAACLNGGAFQWVEPHSEREITVFCDHHEVKVRR